jgi:hypothetical protein
MVLMVLMVRNHQNTRKATWLQPPPKMVRDGTMVPIWIRKMTLPTIKIEKMTHKIRRFDDTITLLICVYRYIHRLFIVFVVRSDYYVLYDCLFDLEVQGGHCVGLAVARFVLPNDHQGRTVPQLNNSNIARVLVISTRYFGMALHSENNRKSFSMRQTLFGLNPQKSGTLLLTAAVC